MDNLDVAQFRRSSDERFEQTLGYARAAAKIDALIRLDGLDRVLRGDQFVSIHHD
jgi:hypothetical protein